MTGTTERYRNALMNTFGAPKLVLARGEGVRVWDEDGKEYLDFLGGIAVNVLGHAHPALVQAVTEQLSTLGHVSNYFATNPQVTLAETLLDLLDGGTDSGGRVFLANSGTEANEAAFKLTRRTGRKHLVAMDHAFHGRTMCALALTWKEAYRAPFAPLPGEVDFVPYGDAEALAAAVTDETAAIVIEPIQGEAGVIVPPDGFLRAAREIADAHGALLWFDEVQSGMGRTGAWFAHQLPLGDGVRPDIVTLAKGLGGGIPIGACIGLGRAGALFEPGNHGTTFGGNPVAAAAALAVIETCQKEGLLEAARDLGAQLRVSLAADPRVVEATGHGLLVGVVLTEPKASEVVAAAQEAGFILNAATPERVRLAPPLIVTAQQIAALAEAWPAILDEAGLTEAVL